MELLDATGEKPIYIQISDWIENEILSGALQANEKVYSQYQLAEFFNINPATAGKGLTRLLEEEIVYQKRGLGTFVAEDAHEKLLSKRRDGSLRVLIQNLLKEATLLGLTKDQLIEVIQTENDELEGKK